MERGWDADGTRIARGLRKWNADGTRIQLITAFPASKKETLVSF